MDTKTLTKINVQSGSFDASTLRGTGNTASSGPYAYDISGVMVRGNNL